MFDNLSIKAKLTILVVTSIVGLAIMTFMSLFALKSSLIEEKEDKVKHLVQSSVSVIDYYYKEYQSGKLSEDDAKQQAKNALASIRYNDGDYFFIIDEQANMVMHPLKPELNGKNMSSAKDPDGKALFSEMTSVASTKGEGTVHYVWEYPATKKPEGKISYIKMYNNWKWIIGTGIYIKDVDEKFTQEAIKLVLIIGVILSILIILSLIVIKKIQLSLSTFKDGLLSFFSYLNKETTNVNMINITSKEEFGQMAQVVNESINKTHQALEQEHKLVQNAIYIANTVSQGDLTNRISQTSSSPTLNELKDVINTMIDGLEKNIGKDVNEIVNVLENYAKYNFMPTVKYENGKIAKITNQMCEMITQLLIENKKNGLILEIDSNKLTKNVEVLNTSANQQASSLEETAASLEEITGNIQSTTQKAQDMKDKSIQTLASASEGKSLALKTAYAMEEINKSTSAISEAITIIDQIAFQTNILSLNAAVEAATAGEAGRGFAVVAGEVRNLASRSSEAANSIKKLVSEATTKTAEGKSISDNMIKGYEELSNVISENTALIEDVANSSREQLSGINQINDAIAQLDSATQENARVANETNEIAIQANEIANTVVKSANSKEFRGKDNIDVSSYIKQTNNHIPYKHSHKAHTGTSHSHSNWDSF